MPFEWYESLKDGDHSIEQGDLLKDCPVVLPPKTIVPGTVCQATVREFDVVILTQSCDLAQGKAESITVSPYFKLTELLKNDGDYQKVLAADNPAKTRQFLNTQAKLFAQGRKVGFHILDKKSEIGFPEHLIVALRRTYNLDIDFVKSVVQRQSNRVRLLPPYREQLSQSFATLFMRVGLPSIIQDV